MSAANHTPVEVLDLLVRGLNVTNWSSWQATAYFMPALKLAEQTLARERVREAAPLLLEALEDTLMLLEAYCDDAEQATRAQARAAIAAARGEA